MSCCDLGCAFGGPGGRLTPIRPFWSIQFTIMSLPAFTFSAFARALALPAWWSAQT